MSGGIPLSTNNGQMTTSSGISGMSSSLFKSHPIDKHGIASESSEKSLELMRLKKEYN